MPRQASSCLVHRQRFELVLAVLSAPLPSKAAISTQSSVKSRPSPSPSPPSVMSSAVTESDDRTDLVNRLVGSRYGVAERKSRE
ncbi:hypothetical protein FCV25MIE_03726 [Fagus crenata]